MATLVSWLNTITNKKWQEVALLPLQNRRHSYRFLLQCYYKQEVATLLQTRSRNGHWNAYRHSCKQSKLSHQPLYWCTTSPVCLSLWLVMLLLMELDLWSPIHFLTVLKNQLLLRTVLCLQVNEMIHKLKKKVCFSSLEKFYMLCMAGNFFSLLTTSHF